MTATLNDPASEALLQAERYAEAADAWTAEGIGDAAGAERCADLLRVIRALAKDSEAARKTETDPHRLAVSAINERWRPVLTTLTAAEAAVKKVLQRYAAEQERQRQAAAAAAALAAAEARRIAEEAARRAAQETTTAAAIAAMKASEEAQAAAAAARAVPEKVTIGGNYGRAVTMRRSPAKARILDEKKAVAWAVSHHHDEVMELVTRLASAKARAGEKLPAYFEVYHEEAIA